MSRLQSTVLTLLCCAMLVGAWSAANASPSHTEIPDPISPLSAPTDASLIRAAQTPIEYVGGFGGLVSGSVTDGSYIYVSEGTSIVIYDVRDDRSPRLIARLPLAQSFDMEVVDGFLYVALTPKNLQIVDVRDPRRPVLRGSVQTADYITDLQVKDNRAYAYMINAGLAIIDVQNPDAPVVRSTTPSIKRSVIIGNTLYSGGQSIQIYDVSNPAQPALRGSKSFSSFGSAVLQASNGLVFLQTLTSSDCGFRYCNDTSAFQIADVRDPANIKLVFNQDNSGAHQVEIVGSRAYVAGSGGLQIIDLSMMAQPRVLGSVSSLKSPFVVDNTTVYGFLNATTLAAVNVSNPAAPIVRNTIAQSTPTRLRMINKRIFAGLDIVDASSPSELRRFGSVTPFGQVIGLNFVGDYAYVTRGQELIVLNIANPATPTPVGRLDLPQSGAIAQVVNNRAYVLTHESSGARRSFLILDVQNPRQPTVIGSYQSPSFGNFTGFTVVSDRAYIVDDQRRFQVVNVSNPANPTLMGDYQTAGPGLSLKVVNNLAYVGENAYFDTPVVNGRVEILDVSNPGAIALAGSYVLNAPPPVYGYVSAIEIVGNRGYFFARETDAPAPSVLIVDLTNPTNPTLIERYTPSPYATSMTVRGNLLYIAGNLSTQATPGSMEIVDVNNPEALIQIATYTGYARPGLVINGRYIFGVSEGAVEVFRFAPPTSATIGAGSGTLTSTVDGTTLSFAANTFASGTTVTYTPRRITDLSTTGRLVAIEPVFEIAADGGSQPQQSSRSRCHTAKPHDSVRSKARLRCTVGTAASGSRNRAASLIWSPTL